MKLIYQFDNLVIFENGKKEENSYILRYEPTPECYKNPRQFDNYSGRIIFYNLKCKKISVLELKDGVNTNNNLKSGCEAEFVEEATVSTNGVSIGGEGSLADFLCRTT